jgi:hypothetical protein
MGQNIRFIVRKSELCVLPGLLLAAFANDEGNFELPFNSAPRKNSSNRHDLSILFAEKKSVT